LFLVAPARMTDEARVRLETMVRTSNGFEIAEADLQLRGPGEFFGTRQSVISAFTLPIPCATANCSSWRAAKPSPSPRTPRRAPIYSVSSACSRRVAAALSPRTHWLKRQFQLASLAEGQAQAVR